MLHLHADPIRDTQFAGCRHPFLDCNRTITHAVANYKKHEALKYHLSGVPLSRQDSRSADQEAASGDGPQTAVHAEAGDELYL